MPHQEYLNKNKEKLSSVTQVLSIINNRALFYWGIKMVKQGIDPIKYTAETAKIGTLTHSIVQFSIDKTPIEWSKYTKDQILTACKISKRYFEWREYQYKLENVMSECAFVSEKYQYGGCLDAIFRIDNEIVLFDFKTSSAIYDEMIAQVAAYKQLAEENGIKIDKCVILRLGRDDDYFEYREISKKELKQGLKVFKSALKLYKEKKELEKVLKESEV